jgi:nitrate/nitrite transporter NarK
LYTTYLGANIAQLSLAAGVFTMLTFIPIYVQSGLGHPSAEAGLMMLPLAVPVFIVPRIVATHLAHRLTGRALLSAGLFLVCLGLFWLAFVVQAGGYAPLTGGMLLTGIGAGLLNGETTKVAMTVIPKERSGMASGVSGTVRFTGLVVGIAALGAVLYGRVAASVTAALPNISYIDRLALVHDITAGKLSGLGLPGYASSNIQVLAVASFTNGYHALFLAGALFMLLATILTWRLVNPADTQPVSAPSPKRDALGIGVAD